MNEFDLIRRYFAPLATSSGADNLRDDVAEISPGLIATKDAIVEGIHFLPDDPLESVAQKLVRVNVSDIIAKGGKPDAALLALIWPKTRPHTELEGFARGLGKDLERWGAHLAGGDTTSTDGPLTLTLTLLGRVGPRGPVRRSGASPGDDIWVTGTIGDGALGLAVAQGRLADPTGHLLDRYRLPRPRLGLALGGLAPNGLVTASMDVSDGLVQDLGHICRHSGLGAEVEAARVPLSAPARAAGPDWMATILTGGDDYEVLMTLPPDHADAMRAEAHRAGIPITRIGRMVPGLSTVCVLDSTGAPISLGPGGWSHF